jgi:hypothetical protein
VRNSEDFIHTLGRLWVQLNDNLLSFDTVSLFARVPIGDSLHLLSQQLDEGNIRLLHHVLTSSFFCFNSQFYEQTDGVVLDSSLSPVMANFFVQDSEEAAFSTAAYKPMCWFHYVADTL